MSHFVVAGLLAGHAGCSAGSGSDRQGELDVPAADGGSAGAGSNQTGDGAAGAAGAAGIGNLLGTAGMAGAAGPALGNTPGQFTPRADLDKDATFDWTESLPGQGTCKPGKYTGMFSCEYVPNGGMKGSGTQVSGPVTLELQKSMDGEFLEIADGELTGVAAGVFGFTSKLSGKLDCNTFAFEAKAVDGVYGFGDPKVFPFGTFDGGLMGTFDDQALSMMGDWQLTENSGGTCSGPWMVSFTP